VKTRSFSLLYKVNEAWEGEEFSTSLNTIKVPSVKLFAFSQIQLKIDYTITEPVEIHPDAEFLFANTLEFSLRIDTKNMQALEKLFEIFGGTKLAFFTLDLTGIPENLRLSSKVQSHVNALLLHSCSGSLKGLLYCDNEKEVAWPRLTELKISYSYECKNLIFTEDLFESCSNLRKLELNLP
jgi:hypothetical protein